VGGTTLPPPLDSSEDAKTTSVVADEREIGVGADSRENAISADELAYPSLIDFRPATPLPAIVLPETILLTLVTPHVASHD
jgi:hypothetical protein